MNPSTADLIKQGVSNFIEKKDIPPQEPPKKEEPKSEELPGDDDNGKKDNLEAPKGEEEKEQINVDLEKTKFKAVPYSRFKELNDKNKALEKQIEELKSKPTKTLEGEDQEVYDEMKNKFGFVDKQEASINALEMEQKKVLEEQSKLIEKQISTMEKEFDGSDGLPKFEKKDIIERGIENNIYDPKSAYIMKNLTTIINHFVNEEVSKRRTPMKAKPQEPEFKEEKIDTSKLSTKDGSLTDFLTKRLKGLASARGM